MGGGAWPFLVGGVICLVNSVNERDLGLLTSWGVLMEGLSFQKASSADLVQKTRPACQFKNTTS